MKKVLMVVVVMLLVASGVYFGYSQGVNKNDNNHNTSEESKKNETNENNDISIDDLNEINDIAGLGMYSMERILSSSPSIINERSIESKSDMLFQIFIRSNILEYKGSDDPVYKSEEYLNNKELSSFGLYTSIALFSTLDTTLIVLTFLVVLFQLSIVVYVTL